jgi:hypothetical protein
MLLAVMNRNSQANEIRQHRGTARPGLDRTLVVRSTSCLNLFQQVRVDKWTFFN